MTVVQRHWRGVIQLWWAMQTKLTQQKSAQKIGALAAEEVPAHVVVSGGRRDSDPVPFGSPRAADAPFGSPATLAVGDEAAAVTQNGAGLSQVRPAGLDSLTAMHPC